MSSNIRISQQLTAPYNPDGTPGTIYAGAPGSGPTDTQISAAVSTYLNAHPPLVTGTVLPPNNSTLIGPGNAGANDVVVNVTTNGTKDAWLIVSNGADPTNATGRTPSNLTLVPEFGGQITLVGPVTLGTGPSSFVADYDNANGKGILNAPTKILLNAPTIETFGGAIVWQAMTTFSQFVSGQVATDPGTLGGFNSLWARTDGGWYARPAGGSPNRLMGNYGSGTAFPVTGVLDGDLYRHTGLGCTMRYNGTAWRQTEITTVANAAGRTAISTSYSSLMHQGFRVYQTDVALTWEWIGSTWTTQTYGPFSGTSNASSDIVVSHGLGVVPTAVVATSTINGAVDSNTYAVRAVSSTNFTVTCYYNGAKNPSTSQSMYWVAYV